MLTDTVVSAFGLDDQAKSLSAAIDQGGAEAFQAVHSRIQDLAKDAGLTPGETKIAEAMLAAGILTGLATRGQSKTVKALVEHPLFKTAMAGFRDLAATSKTDIERLGARITQRMSANEPQLALADSANINSVIRPPATDRPPGSILQMKGKTDGTRIGPSDLVKDPPSQSSVVPSTPTSNSNWEPGTPRPPGWRLSKKGTWSGEPGHSEFSPNDPAEAGLQPGETIPFKGGMPDFSRYSKAEFLVPGLDGDEGDRDKIRRYMAKNSSSFYPKFADDKAVKKWLREHRLYLHHAEDSERGTLIQLVPYDLHEYVRHMGVAQLMRRRIRS